LDNFVEHSLKKFELIDEEVQTNLKAIEARYNDAQTDLDLEEEKLDRGVEKLKVPVEQSEVQVMRIETDLETAFETREMTLDLVIHRIEQENQSLVPRSLKDAKKSYLKVNLAQTPIVSATPVSDADSQESMLVIKKFYQEELPLELTEELKNKFQERLKNQQSKASLREESQESKDLEPGMQSKYQKDGKPQSGDDGYMHGEYFPDDVLGSSKRSIGKLL
jgi:hypothetical protein